MKIHKLIYTTTYLAAVLAVLNSSAFATEGIPPVLDYQNHPQSPGHSDIYTGDLLPLDASLSWTNRFNGDETFNELEVLPTHRSNSMSMRDESGNHLMGKSLSKMDHMKMDNTGMVKGIRMEQGKIKIQHGPIDKYGMPEMTMVFKVDDPSILEGLNKGDKVGFNIDNSSGGFVVTHIMSMTMMNTKQSESIDDNSEFDTMDASGVIKTIRASQGKVKIEHGPIDKYGMPAMTMVFKVQNPADLETLEKGMAVEFDIDTSSGGFEIIQIKPKDQ